MVTSSSMATVKAMNSGIGVNRYKVKYNRLANVYTAIAMGPLATMFSW